jgi:hypothetical protein
MSSEHLAGVSLLIGTPAAGDAVHMDYVRSLFAFQQAGIRFELAMIGSTSPVARARNALISGFYARPAHTHLLFLDPDVHLPADELVRMLGANVPVLGVPLQPRQRDTDSKQAWTVGRTLGSNGALIRVESVGTGALLLSRAACAALVEDALANGRVYQKASAGNNSGADIQYDVFWTGAHDGTYVSDDAWVCRRLYARGFDVLVDPTLIATRSPSVPI